MRLFLVQRGGNYPAGVLGVFDSILKAETCMAKAKSNERDSSHTFTIYEFNLNSPYLRGGVDNEEKMIAKIEGTL